MPANFPEIWLAAIIRIFSSAMSAPWLDGITEIAANVSTINAGSVSEKNIIHVPETTFEAEVLVNNTTYPIDVQVYEDGTIDITLDKYQTKVTSLSDDQTIGASYDKIKEVTRSHTEPIVKKKYQKALHSIAPASNAAATPVITTTGADDGTGRKRLTYNDLVALKSKIDANDTDQMGRRLVLCSDHWNDLALDRDRFGDKFMNYETGKVMNVLNFEIYPYIACPQFTAAGVKVAFGAVAPAGSHQASVFFQKDNIGKKTGDTKQYFLPAVQNPRTQSNELNYRHYFVAMPYKARYIGAIVSGTV